MRLHVVAVVLGCLPGVVCVAQSGDRTVTIHVAQSGAGKDLTPEEYVVQIAQLRTAVNACKAAASACDPDKAGSDPWVQPESGNRFEAERDWLRDALREAKKDKDADRAALMDKASARLTSDAAEITGTPAPLPPTADARAKADAILSHPEFKHVEQENALVKEWALIGAWIASLFSAVKLPNVPGLVPLLEWGLLVGAAIGLLIWAWRTSRQQRLAVSTGPIERQTVWQKESDDWARRAEAEATRGDWREAVHCLYWAAIVMLEGRRLWRANRARTPREYLPLLEAGSARQRALGGLTRIFERIWYGLRPASRQDFERAQALLEELKAN